MSPDNEVQAGNQPAAQHGERELDLKRDQEVVLKSTLDDLGLWATIKRFPKAVLVCQLVCIAAAADGYQLQLNGNIIANQGFINKVGFPNAEGVYTLHADYTALWGAMQSLGQLVGMLLLNPISDKVGRKMTMYILWAIICGSLIIESTVSDWKMWTGAKLLAGIGIGSRQATLPVYVTEWSPVNIRGANILAYGLWNNVGKFFAPPALYIVQQSNNVTNYKVPILTQWGFLAVMLPIFLWLPETPYYYAKRDEDEKGKATLRRVNGNVEGYDLEKEYGIIKNTILEERREMEHLGLNNHDFKQLIRSYVECLRGTNARRTFASALPACAQQLTGLAFLGTYASLFFKQSGFSNPFLITTIFTVIAIGTYIVTMLTSDYFGRRRIVLVSVIVATVCMLVVGVFGIFKQTPQLKNLLIFVGCVWDFFNIALGGLGWSFVGEISSQKLRVRTAGIAAALSVIFGLIFNTSVPIMINVDGANWGYNTGWLFLGTGVCVSILVYFYVPEPSQRNFAEMDEMYEKGVPAWRMRKYVTDVQRMQQRNISGTPMA
ncbi:hypothetical protein V500_11544 [Pseudogymnoascus sp. VKM F-4518 (FW-2643)]|nr:hypothetical protein V500_11544 [Pseudogymnoascus sp. VKM F-4518 (FW-2643)]